MDPLQGGSVTAAPAPAAPEQQPVASTDANAQNTEAANSTQPVPIKPSTSPMAQPAAAMGQKPQPPSTNSGGRGMTALEREAALQLLGMLAKYKEADPFRKPVDWENLGIPDYPSVIKQPMDLGTVRSKLKCGAYASMDAWKADMALIWDNCRKYNGPLHPFSMLAEKLEAAMERRMEEAFAAAREVAARGEAGKKPKVKPQRESAAPRASAASDDSQDDGKPAMQRVGSGVRLVGAPSRQPETGRNGDIAPGALKRVASSGLDGAAAAAGTAAGGSNRPAVKRKASTAPGSNALPGLDMDALEQLVNTPAAKTLGARRPEQLAFLQLWKNIVSSEEAAVAEAESLHHTIKKLKRTVAATEEQVRELRIALEAEVSARRAAEEHIKELKADHDKLQSEHKQQNFVLEHQKQLLEQQQQVIRQVLGQKSQQQQQQQQPQQDKAPAAVQGQVTPAAGPVPEQRHQQQPPVSQHEQRTPQHTSQGGQDGDAMES